jgi:hypothetical protein
MRPDAALAATVRRLRLERGITQEALALPTRPGGE